MKKILLGVTGGISAYKSTDLTSQFVKLGTQIDMILFLIRTFEPTRPST